MPARRNIWGGVAKYNLLFINAVFWIMSTGAVHHGVIYRLTMATGKAASANVIPWDNSLLAPLTRMFRK